MTQRRKIAWGTIMPSGLYYPHPRGMWACCVRCKSPVWLTPDECGCLCRRCCRHWDGRLGPRLTRRYGKWDDDRACQGWRYHRDA